MQLIKRRPEEKRPWLPDYWIYMPSTIRKIVYAVLFESLAVVISTFLFAYMADAGSKESFVLSVLVSLIALTWNFAFNTAFEFIEDKIGFKRTPFVRCIYSFFFEGGLVAACVPLYMFWYDMGFLQALGMELSILVFFLVFTYVFSLTFDSFVLRKLRDQDEEAV